MLPYIVAFDQLKYGNQYCSIIYSTAHGIKLKSLISENLLRVNDYIRIITNIMLIIYYLLGVYFCNSYNYPPRKSFLNYFCYMNDLCYVYSLGNTLNTYAIIPHWFST